MPFDTSAITAPFRMQPGLRRLAPRQQQLTANRLGDAVLAAKLAVLRRHPSQALCKLPGWDDRPALDALIAQAMLDWPEAWATDTTHGQERHTAKLLGCSLIGDRVECDGPSEIGACLQSLPAASRLAGLLSLAFAEDFAVLEVTAGAGGRIPWLAVCLPSHWDPQAKLGKTFAEVHAPVADNQALLHAADALSHLVTGSDRWQREVWTVTPSGLLDGHPGRQPSTRWPDQADAGEIGALAWLRTEHQTFLPVPGQTQAVFTIHVEVRRLSQMLADPITGSQLCSALHAAIASMSPAVLEYRGLSDARERLLAWLADPDGG